MSDTLTRNRDFIKLMLNTEDKQAYALLSSITDNQLKAIIEICFNLLRIKHNVKDNRIIKNRKNLLSKISNSRTSLSRKRQPVVKNKRTLLKTLKNFRLKLLSLLK